MTDQGQRVRKLSISVPEDVAERLEQEPNTSAFLVDTVRARMRAEQFRAELARRGMTLTPEGRANAAARLAQAEADWPTERFTALREHARQSAADMLHEPTGQQAPAA